MPRWHTPSAPSSKRRPAFMLTKWRKVMSRNARHAVYAAKTVHEAITECDMAATATAEEGVIIARLQVERGATNAAYGNEVFRYGRHG